MQQVIFWQEMARAGAPPMANVLGLGLVGPTIIAFGTDAQKARYLRKILSAEEIWCQGFSEPNAGSDLAGLQTDARLDGDHYVVNGQKVWTSYGWAADWCELVVRTDPAAPKHKGLTVLLVDMRSPGVDVRPLQQMTGETEFNEVFFRDVRVPVENVVGNVNQGWDVAIGTLMHERGTFGAGLQITYKRNMDRLIALSRTVQRNGRPAAEDPVIRQKLAQCYAEVEIMRANQMRAFSRISATGVPGPEGSIQKIFWSELNQRLQQVAQELLGPVRPARRRRPPRDRSRRLVVRLPPRARQHDRSRHVGSAAQHHRPLRAGPAEELLTARVSFVARIVSSPLAFRR